MTDRPHEDCERLLARVSAYLDEELDPATCETIEAHCATCRRCGALVASLRQTIGLCRATGRDPLPPEVAAKARASIERLLAGRRRA